MGFWEHRAVQDKNDLEALKDGTVRDSETPPEEMDRRRLSPRQMTALKAFHSGSSLKDAAKAAGVTRQTLHRWRTQYHSFSEAMDVWEEGQMVIARSRLVDMADNAIDALTNAIEDGDARAAMLVLKSLRILRTYGPVKAPAEKMPAAAVLPPLNDRGEEPAYGAGFQPAASGRHGIGEEQAGRLHHNGNENGNGKATENGTAARDTAVGTTAPPAQQIDVISNPAAERPKTAILPGKAGSAIQNACYSALKEVTGSYEMLHADRG